MEENENLRISACDTVMILFRSSLRFGRVRPTVPRTVFPFICNILNKSKYILICLRSASVRARPKSTGLRAPFPVNHIFKTAISLCNRSKFSFAHAFFFHINELIFYTALLEETFCFLCIIAFLASKNLYIHLLHLLPIIKFHFLCISIFIVYK